MPLNIATSSGEYLPFVKYNAKADKWFLKKDKMETELKSPTFVADLANIKTGWFMFVEGQAPSIVYDPNLSTPAAKPSDGHKRGFKMTIFSNNLFGGAAEFSASSMHVNSAVAELYNQWEKEAPANAGKMPVVSCTGSVPQKDRLGTNYKPVLAIVKWVDNPMTDTAPSVASVAPVAKVVSEF